MEQQLVNAILADEAVVVLTGADRAVRTADLDRAIGLLEAQRCRIVWIDSPNGEPIDLRQAMTQIGGGDSDESLERFFEAIVVPTGFEQRIVVVIDDAHLATSDLLNYLAQIGPSTAEQPQRPQILLVGDPSLWDSLPRTGTLAADGITARFVAGVEAEPKPAFALVRPIHDAVAPLVPSAAAVEEQTRPTPPPILVTTEPPPLPAPAPVEIEPIVETPAIVVGPETQPRSRRVRVMTVPPAPVEGPTDPVLVLRNQLAADLLRRQGRPAARSRIAIRLFASALAIAVVVASAVVWAQMPAIGVVVRHWVSPPPKAAAVDPKIARGYRLLGAGDVLAAQAVFRRAVEAGLPAAMTGLAKTYDPHVLELIPARAATPDRSIAENLYRQAIAMGDQDAVTALKGMQDSTRR